MPEERKKYTYEELDKLSFKELMKIRTAELDRIAENEKKRQEAINYILVLQEITDNTDWVK